MTGGNLEGKNDSVAWTKSLTILAKLYKDNKADFNDNNLDPDTCSFIINLQKMAFAIAIVYVNKVTDSIKHNIYSDPNTRYSIYKKMHNEYDLEDKKHFAKLLRERIAANKYVEKPHSAKSDINQALPANVKNRIWKTSNSLRIWSNSRH